MNVHMPRQKCTCRGCFGGAEIGGSRLLKTVPQTATQTLRVEWELDIPPSDLYLNKRVAEFEARLRISGMDQTIRNSTAAVASWLRRRRHRPNPESPNSLRYELP